MFEKTVFGVFLAFAMWFGTTSAQAQTPSKPTVTATRASATSIQLDWTAPAMNSAGITAYHVRWRSAATDGPDGMSGTSDDVAAGTWQNASGDDTDCAAGATSPEDCGHELGVVLSYTVAGLTRGTRYEFQARAENASGVGTWSDAVELTALGIDASLSALTLSSGVALSPAFDSATPSYTVEVRSNRSDLDITPTATDASGASIQVGKSGSLAAVASGSASTQSIDKTSGTAAQDATSNTFLVVVTAEDGTTTGTYQIAVSRLAARTDTSLSALTLPSGVALSPAFDSATSSYTVEVRSGRSDLAITPTATDAGGASIQVGKPSSLAAVDSGSASTQNIDKTSGTAAQDATENTFLIVVTAEDGTTTGTYQIAVSRLTARTDAALSALALSSGVALSPAFDFHTLLYTARVRTGRGNLAITPTATDPIGAKIQVGRLFFGGTVASGAASNQGIDKTAGNAAQDPTHNTFLIVVTAEDGNTTRTYQIAVSRAALGTDATLSSLELPSGVALSPAFDSATLSYTTEVKSFSSNLAVTPTAADAEASIEVGRAGFLGAVASGSASSQGITKTSGIAAQDATENTFLIVVTAEDGTTTRTYQIAVSRAAGSADATLSSLELPSGVVLSPAFDSATLSYTTEVRSFSSNLAVTPTAADAGASIEVGRAGFLGGVASGSASGQGITKTSGTAAQDATANTFLIVVTAEDGTTMRTYEIAVSRAAGRTEATLSALALPSGVVLSPAFDSATLSYTAEVLSGRSSLDITPTVTDAGASIQVGRSGFLGGVASGAASGQTIDTTAGGAAQDATENTFLIVVTAEDGTTTRTYQIAVSRAVARTDATLSALALSSGIALSPAFDSATLLYTVDVRSSMNSLDITPTATDAGASIQVGRSGFLVAVDSGSAGSQNIDVTAGAAAQDATENTFLIVVTADDGTTTRTYQIALSRLAVSADATLSALTLSSGVALSPAFDPATPAYTADVRTSWDRFAITATATDAEASIQVGRASFLEAVDSGSPSIQDIDTTDGTAAQNAAGNTFLVVVTAEDGTIRTYQISVSRLAVAANPSADASLMGLTVTGGTLRPAFSAGTSSYDLSVPADTGTVTFTPTATDSEAAITVGRASSPSSSLAGGASSDQLLEVGGGAGSAANVFLIIVTAEDGTTTSTYTVNVFRASPITKILIHDSSVRGGARTDANSLLSTAAVPGGATAFDPTVQTYSLRVPRSVGEVVITPTFGSGTVQYQRTQPRPATALVAIASAAASSPVALADGVNVIVIRFEMNSQTVDYRITIARFGLDVDGGGAVAVDGILIARYLLGERGASLLSGQSNAMAMTLEAAIKVGVDAQFLSAGANGILVARYVLGVRGARLTGGFSGLDATEEAAKILRLLPAAP